ncbi:hypothetical protein E4U39_007086 [Claviceps sp. Clav50 group G5]|nr:hypothetical protein E4U39_007086 [Claviceps sp. Clav50 group G5]
MPPRVSIDHHDGNDYSDESSSEDCNNSFGPFPDEEEDNAIEHFPHEDDLDDEVHIPTVMETSWEVKHSDVNYTYREQSWSPHLARLKPFRCCINDARLTSVRMNPEVMEVEQ